MAGNSNNRDFTKPGGLLYLRENSTYDMSGLNYRTELRT